MIPSAANSDYPKFVADQVLTSDNLNNLFGYLDEQGRITRTNLSGIGIVCGLEVKTAADGSSITITQGVGVTSSGYLVSVPEVKYIGINTFNALKCEYYDEFVTNESPRTKRFDLWELKQEAESEGTTALTKAFLTSGEKIVLIFVELLDENNKNCDPSSCDDKGAKVTVNFRPLLIKSADANSLISSTESNITSEKFNSLPDIFLPRWDAPNTNPVNADQIFLGYKNILTQTFILSVQTVLSNAYNTFKPVIADEYPTDPFVVNSLIIHYNFLFNGPINTNQSIHIQYYYDLFSDLIEAYNEFCITGSEILSTCCPDESLFPRHLLLGESISLPLDTTSSYRHYFMYSPLFERKDLLGTLKLLFRRMDLMVKSFLIPPVAASMSDSIDLNIKITPSKLSRAPLSAKAIPYYFTPNALPVPLYKFWSVEKSLRNRAQQILSYNSDQYNTTDDFVNEPLKYDLESYNFFRIEGITGKQLKLVLDSINNRILNARLPIQVVPVSTGNPLSGSENDECCVFSDIELQYQLIRNELLCCLKSNIRYWASLEKQDNEKGIVVAEPKKVRIFTAKNDTSAEKISTEDEKLYRSGASQLLGKSLEKIETAIETTGNLMLVNYAKGEFLKETLSEIQESSFASDYLEYQLHDNITMGSLPAPKTNDEVENITYYILIIIDELEELAGLLSEPNIEVFNIASFMVHAEKLSEASAKLDKLLSAYSLTEYQIDKIRINAPSKTAEIDKIAAAMPVINDDDTNKIILLLLNLSSSTDFITQLQRKTGSYSAQVEIISKFFTSLDKDGMMVPIIKEPDTRTDYTYSSIQDHLKTEMCSCDIQNLNYLIDKYIKQRATLSDVNNFSVYTKNHPGIQHKAGVTSGGTFVIVYKGSNDPGKDIATNTVIGDFYLPYSCCSDCTPVQVIIQEPPLPVNQPPVAKAGDDISIQLPVNEVILDGTSSSDPDGVIKTYLWENKSGPAGFIIEDSSAAKTKLGKLEVGEYIFKLTVTDDDNSSSTDDVKITVLALPKHPPTANAGPDQIIEIESAITHLVTGSAQLDGSLSSDPDGTIVSFSWAKISGPSSGLISKPLSAKPLVTELSFGVYVFELTVTDNDDLTGKDQVSIAVNVNMNQAPIANAGPDKTLTLPQNSLQLDGSDSIDPDGTIVSFDWSLTSGPTGSADISNPDNEITQVTFKQVGTYEFKLIVTDNKGLSDSATATVTVLQAENKPPIANATAKPTSLVLVPEQQFTVQLDGSGSTDPDGSIKSFLWTLSSGPTSVTIVSPDSSISTVEFSQPGNYNFTLTVTDDRGKTDSATTPVTVTQEIVTVKTCALLNNIISDFDKISRSDTPSNFKVFIGQSEYADMNDIIAFFDLMKNSNMVNQPVDKQINFFIEQKIESRLVTWIDDLKIFILDLGVFRLLALATLNVLTELAYFISCIQKDDVNKARVKMANALTSESNILQVILQVALGLPADQRSVLATMNTNAKDERTRVRNNGEESVKPAYVVNLATILDNLKAMNL
ncbi:MAG TPA: PKD domain-containing protein [Prolixibacteraceae bacterium]|nr:PKD domain-containing protein [Prolixibacteraceae bacterium]